jgi:hypothetical protein
MNKIIHFYYLESSEEFIGIERFKYSKKHQDENLFVLYYLHYHFFSGGCYEWNGA